MSHSHARPAPVAVAVAVALVATLAAAQPAAAKYDPKYRPYRCFMKDFMDWDLGDMNHSFNAAPDARYDFDEAKLKQAAEAGASFLGKHGATVEALLAGYAARALAPLPSYDPARLETIDFESPVVHFRYSREIARGLVCVAAKLFQDGRGRDAWRLVHAAIRFGAALRAGDGDPSTLIQVMIGDAIMNIAAGPFTWQLLAESNLTAADLSAAAAELSATRRELAPFRRAFEGEYHGVRNTIRDHLFDAKVWSQGDGDRQIFELLDQIAPDARSKAVAIVLKRHREVFDRTYAALDRHAQDPVGAGAALEAIAAEVTRRGSPSLGMILSPVEAVADLLLTIAYPNMKRAFVKDSETLLRIEALRAGCLALAALREGGDGAGSPERAFAAAGTLPVDLYAATHAVRIAARADRTVLYSVGENGVDDGGTREEDLVLFEIRRAAAAPTVTRALLDELEGKDEAAARAHRRVAEATADPAVRKTASRRLERLGGGTPPAAEGTLMLFRVEPTELIAALPLDADARRRAEVLLDAFLTREAPGLRSVTLAAALPGGSRGDAPGAAFVVCRDRAAAEAIRSRIVKRGIETTVAEPGTLVVTHGGLSLGAAPALLARSAGGTGDAPGPEPAPLLAAAAGLARGPFLLRIDRPDLLPEETLGNVPREALAGAGPVEMRLSGESLLLYAGSPPEALAAFAARYPALGAVSVGAAPPEAGRRGFASAALVPLAAPVALAAKLALPLVEREILPTLLRREVKACRANLKVLEGAAELYRMDHPAAAGSPLTANPVAALVDEKYLKSAPACPAGGVYGYEGGAFRCSRHGGLASRIAARLLAADGGVLAAGTTEAEYDGATRFTLAPPLPVMMELRVTPTVDDDDAPAGRIGLTVEATAQLRTEGVARTARREANLKGGFHTPFALALDPREFGGATLEVTVAP